VVVSVITFSFVYFLSFLPDLLALNDLEPECLTKPGKKVFFLKKFKNSLIIIFLVAL
jgi:hypothetical protein